MTSVAAPCYNSPPMSGVTAPWWELTVEVREEDADEASVALIDAGAGGVEVREPLGGGPPALIAAFEISLAPDVVKQQALDALKTYGLSPRVDLKLPLRRSDKDWAHAWKQYFKPLKMGRKLWIVPSWENHFLPPTGSLSILIDPGMAFGTGQHATTSLCARAIEDWAEARTQQTRRRARLLDVGTGSGILALVGAALGIGHADAVDNDPEAIAAAQQNIERNQQNNHVAASTWDIAQVPGLFDLVVANILAPTLEAMAPALVRRLAPGARLVLSGILAPQAEGVIQAVRAALSAAGKQAGAAVRLTHGEWVALIFEI